MCFESASLFIINERIVVLFDLDFNHLLLSLFLLLSTVALKVFSPRAYVFDLGSQNSLKKVICKVSLNQDLRSHILILFLSSSSFGIICRFLMLPMELTVWCVSFHTLSSLFVFFPIKFIKV